ncbi:nose resistant to fluoxetine protein 6-like [Schistocerca serialis cubense]|uniref:nose resistant to fluoxetine protein 6-like n=1 Tax=Schistocerca serialis cubense TaxID=2023355 RepID=UPI00214EC443|nr:nose resistant to fluoxetine protein 6-like [Schistocerca serialis cubense]
MLLAAAAVTAPEVTAMTPRCETDNRVVNQAARNGSLWALRMLDSWGQLPVPGFLEGNTALLGNFDECLDAGAKYCLATVHLPQASLRKLLDGNAPIDDLLAAQRQVLATTPGHALRWAACVPPSCEPADVVVLLQKRVASLLPGVQADAVAVDVQQSLCSVNETSPLEPKDWAFLGAMVLVAVILIVSTVCDIVTSKSNQLQKGMVWEAFSVRRNWISLTAISNSGFCSVHGLKCLTMAWVILYHVYKIDNVTPAINWDTTVTSTTDDWTTVPLISGGSLAVDSFFLMSGMLVGFGFLRERAHGQPFGLFRFYLQRYLRLTPPYAVMIWFYATFLPRLGNGPLWSEEMVVDSEQCTRHWWHNLLYVNNYEVRPNVCMDHTWYLAVDMQLFWASPLLLWALYKWRRAGRVLLLGIVFAASAAAFAITFCYSLPWGDIPGLPHEQWAEYVSLMYVPTYSRIVPYVTGVGLGWVLFYSKDKKCGMNEVVVSACWAASTALALFATYGLHLSYHRPYSRLEAALFATLQPLAWALSISWVIYACEKGRAGPVKTLLSWRGFQPLAKLSYCVYLAHSVILFYHWGITRTPITFGRYYIVQKALGVLLMVLPVAAVLSLSFEMPVLNLSKAFLNPGRQQGNCWRSRTKPVSDATEQKLPADPQVRDVHMTVENSKEQSGFNPNEVVHL